MRSSILLALFALVLTGCAITLEENFLFWVPKNVDFMDTDEAGTELFMGRALVKPLNRDLTARGYWTTKIEFRVNEEAFIPVEISRDEIQADDIELAILRIDRADRAPDLPVFVHCGGIGHSLYNNAVQHALKLLPFGDVIQFDMPGHGLSGGEASVADLEKAVTAMASYAAETASDRPLIFYGHSLGGYLCAGMADQSKTSDGLIIEASGTDAGSVAQSWIPIAFRPFLRLRMDEDLLNYNIPLLLEHYDRPILAISGERDKVMPSRLVEQVATELEADGHNVRFVEMRGMDHSTIPFAENFTPTLRAFLSQLPQQP